MIYRKERIEINKIKDYRISGKTIITRKDGRPLYDMYIVTLIHEDNTSSEIKVFTGINTIDINNKQLVENFIIKRLLGDNNLMEKEGRDDYIFLGQLNKDDKSINRFYIEQGTNKNAQQYFDEIAYPLLKASFEENQGMYSKIQSPLDNEETIRTLIKLYATSKSVNPDDFYRQVIYYDNENSNDMQKHLKEFQENIMIPNFTKLYANIIKEKNNPIMNDQRVRRIFERFKTYDEFCDYVYQSNARDIYSLYNNMKSSPNNKHTYINKLSDFHLSNEELNFRILAGWIERNLVQDAFDGGEGIMGFHVNPQNLKQTNANKQQPQMKFYINAGYDTYRFARYFQEKCEQRNLNYYFKVVDPYKQEHERADKLCIYTDFNNADIFLQCIEEVRKEHPEIRYRRPPLIAGTIQNYIGVGTDGVLKSGASYNSGMSEICFGAMKNVFNGIPKKDILDMVKRKPELIKKVRDMIIGQATRLGLSQEKICIMENAKSRLGKQVPKKEGNIR